MPIIYSNYKQTNNGINLGGNNVVGFIGEIPYGIQYFQTLKLWEILARDCGLISYVDEFTSGDGIDKIGFETRPSITGKYILGDGTLTADLGLNNEPITYLNVDTMLDVATTTDASGLFTFPSSIKVGNIKIPSTGDIFHLEEGTGDTIADSVNGRIAKLSDDVTFVDSILLPSQANLVGYMVGDGNNYFWDEELSNIVDINVIIPNLSATESASYYSEIFPFILKNGEWDDIGTWDDNVIWVD